MDEYREAQRRKWAAEKAAKQDTQAPATDGASSSGSAGPMAANGATSSSSDAAFAAVAAPKHSPSAAANGSPPPASPEAVVAQGEKPMARRLHILPVGTEVAAGEQRRLELLAPELRRKRDAKEIMKTGLFLRSGGHDFIVVKVEPEDSLLSSDTDYYVDGEPIQRFEKVQFIGLWDFESHVEREDSSVLFSEYISPYFRSVTDSGEDRASIIIIGEVMKIFDLNFQVMAGEPTRDIGIIDQNTMVFVDWDGTPEFDKIHIVPFQDTLPHAYQFDVFNDYLKPYLTRHKHMCFNVNDQFTYQGVQFKVVCCEPPGPARVGRNTTIFCEGVLHPSLRNLLPPELLEQLSNLPPGLQMLLLNTEALAGGYEERLIEVQEMLSRRRGLNNETIERVEKFRWGQAAGTVVDGQTQCMVCLCDFEADQEVRRLPCRHLFHANCIDEWLRRCTDCPICKANVDRAVRQY